MSRKVSGFIAGACGVMCFYLTIGVVGVYLVLDRVEKETDGRGSLFGEWYQVVLFILSVFFFLMMILFVYINLSKKREEKLNGKKECAKKSI